MCAHHAPSVCIAFYNVFPTNGSCRHLDIWWPVNDAAFPCFFNKSLLSVLMLTGGCQGSSARRPDRRSLLGGAYIYKTYMRRPPKPQMRLPEMTTAATNTITSATDIGVMTCFWHHYHEPTGVRVWEGWSLLCDSLVHYLVQQFCSQSVCYHYFGICSHF